MAKYKLTIAASVLLALCAFASAQYLIPRSSINSGGAPGTGTGYALNGSAAQAVQGTGTGTGYLGYWGFWYGLSTPTDLTPTALLVPAPGSGYDTSAVLVPKVKVRNQSSATLMGASIVFRIDSTAGNTVYADTIYKNFAPNGESTFSFKSWSAINVVRSFSMMCSSYVVGDTKPSNDKLTGTFTLNSAPPGWYLKSQMPVGAKPIKDGAWLTYDAGSDAGTGRIYASRGNKQPDFFSYNPVKDSWKALAPWLPGTEGKLPGKGSVGCADGSGHVYATKGNNKSGFWMYDAAANAWTQKKDVPLGVSNKKIKGGTAITWAYKGGVGSAYLLKGYKNEFYKYVVAGDSWQTLTPAPVGGNQKWDKGSWMTSDGGHMLYAHKGKYMEFYSYNTEKDSWSGPLVPMPTAGSGGSKKAKDGSCGAFTPAGVIFALKGGNTQEYWQCSFTTDGNSWAEKETMPKGALKKKVKSGASIASVGSNLYAFKGNKSNELWMYVPGSTLFEAPRHDGVVAGKTVIAQGMSISPNPLASGRAVLRYGLPKAGAATLRIYDVSGRSVLTQTLLVGRSGSANLDLKHLSAGVYLAKLTVDDYSTTQKLVVQR